MAVIGRNGPGVTGLHVTAVKTACLEPHADAAGDAAGEPHDRTGRLPGGGADGAVPRHGRLPGGGARPHAHRRGAEPGDPQGQAPVGAGPDQCPARPLDPGDRHRAAGHRRIRTAVRRRGRDRRGGAVAERGDVPGHPLRRGRRARRRDPRLRRPGRAARRAGLLRLPAQRQFPGPACAGRRSARLPRRAGGVGADRPRRRGAGAGHPPKPVLDAALLRDGLLAARREDHPGRHQSGPHRPDQAGRRRHLRRREAGGGADPGQALTKRRRCRARRAAGYDPPGPSRPGRGTGRHGSARGR